MTKGMIGPFVLSIFLALIVSVSAFLIWAFEIPITTIQFLILVACILIIPIIIIVGKKIMDRKPSTSVSRDIDKAQSIAEDFWLKKRHQELSMVDGVGGERDLGEIFYGFLFTRAPRGEQAGMYVVLIIGREPWRVVWWNDNPTPEEIDDPFTKFSTIYRGKPSKKLKPEQEPIILREKYRSKRRPLVEVSGPSRIQRRFYGEREEEKNE